MKSFLLSLLFCFVLSSTQVDDITNLKKQVKNYYENLLNQGVKLEDIQNLEVYSRDFLEIFSELDYLLNELDKLNKQKQLILDDKKIK